MTDQTLTDCQDFNAWGGHFSPQLLEKFLSEWKIATAEQTWAIWEFIDAITITQGEFPYPAAEQGERLLALERLEKFGKWGHLSLRRDGEWFYWHFIGSAGFHVPAEAAFDSKPFSVTPPVSGYQCQEKTALLWGRRSKGKHAWFEDRVAWAKLHYPGVNSERVRVRYREYSQAGRVEFAWLLGLE